MVQILPQKPGLADYLSQGIRETFVPAMQSHLQQQLQQRQAQQQQSLLNQALTQAQQVYADPNLSPEQKQIGLYQALSNRPDIAQALSKQLADTQKQTQAQQMLSQLFGPSPQQGQVSQNHLGMQQPEQQAFNPANLSDAQIAQVSAVNPNLGRLLQQQKDVTLRENRAEREFAEKQRKASPEFQREEKINAAQAQADVQYNRELQESSKQHELKEQTLNRLEKLNTQGVTGKPYEKLLEKAGLVALTSEGRREFAADVKNLITDIRSILGSQFTGFEFQTILNAYPSADFSKAANAAIIKNLKDFQDIKKKEVEFATQLKKENKGKIPEDFQSKVNEKVREYALTKVPEIRSNTQKIMNEEYGIPEGNILMFDPQGEPLNVPKDQIEQYKALGAQLL